MPRPEFLFAIQSIVLVDLGTGFLSRDQAKSIISDALLVDESCLYDAGNAGSLLIGEKAQSFVDSHPDKPAWVRLINGESK